MSNHHATVEPTTYPWLKSYDCGVPHRLNFEPVTAFDMLDRTAAQLPEGPALQFQNCCLTYGCLKRAVDQMTAALWQLGVECDTRVAIHLSNLPQAVIAYYATLRLGGHVVMTNPLYTPREIERQWQDANVKVAITADFLYACKLREIRTQLPVKHYVIASIPEYLRFPLNWLAPLKLRRAKPPMIATIDPEPGVHFFMQLLQQKLPTPPAPTSDLDRVAVLQYTGGTTGVAKGAMLTHRNLSVNVQQCRAWFPNFEMGKEVMMAAAPLFHVFGMSICMNLAVYIGAKIVLLPNPRDIAGLVGAISKHHISIMPAVPAMYNAINQFPTIAQHDLSSLKVCISGSAPISESVQTQFEKISGAKIIEGFGLSETSPVTHVNPLTGKRKIGSIGLPVPNTEATIVDMNDGKTPLPCGQEGELIIRGPQVMKGYWNRPDETAQMVRDGWLYTGDLATMDEEGYFRIVGRKKDMILASGYNVYPDEIDHVLMMHAAILEAATIGVPDAKRGETVKSFVVVKPTCTLTEDEVITHCKKHLAPYKVPKLVEFRNELPKSTVLKVLRRELRETRS